MSEVERLILAAGTQRYEFGAEFQNPLQDLNSVPASLRRIVTVFAELGYSGRSSEVTPYLLDPDVKVLAQYARMVVAYGQVIVVYYTGHGMQPDRRPYYLPTRLSRPQTLDETAIRTRDLMSLMLRLDDTGEAARNQPHVLLILDCCFSALGGEDAINDALAGIGNPNLWVIASASTLEYALEGSFSAALAEALQKVDTGASQQFFGLESLTDKVNRLLGTVGQQAHYFPPGGRSTGLPPFFPNPKWRPGLSGMTVAVQHWRSKIRGAPLSDLAVGYYLTGRKGRLKAIEDLAAWMSDIDDGDLAIITGSPGSGKSTVLALPVLFSGTEFAEQTTRGSNSLIQRALVLFKDKWIVGVHARGLNTDETARAIGDEFRIDAATATELIHKLSGMSELQDRIVIVDALDEARRPALLVSALLEPLSRLPGMRVVVGARRHALPTVGEGVKLVDLDANEYQDHEALIDYARQLLEATNELEVQTPYQANPEASKLVAQAIALKATTEGGRGYRAQSFLIAQLLARAVRGRADVIDTSVVNWVEKLPNGIGSAFDEDITVLGDREPIARVLLTALAWARGPGLPWEHIWLPVASSIAQSEQVDRVTPTDDDIRWLLDSVGEYVVEDIGPGGRSVYRLSHDLLAAHLRGESTRSWASPGGEHARHRQVHRAIAEALLATIPRKGGTRDWRGAHPYVLTYFAQHAQAAGQRVFETIFDEIDFLANADPAVLTAVMLQTTETQCGSRRTYLRARPLLEDNYESDVAYLVEASMATSSQVHETLRSAPAYSTIMAQVSHGRNLMTLSGEDGSMVSMAIGSPAIGPPLLIASDIYGVVRIWDPLSATLISGPLNGRRFAVTTVALGSTGDGGLLLASGAGRKVRLQDPLSNDVLANPPKLSDLVTALAFGPPNAEQALLAIGSSDGRVLVWDLHAGAVVGTQPSTHSREITVVTFGIDHLGRLLLASGASDGSVLIVDALTGGVVRESLSAATGGEVSALAFASDDQGRMLVAIAGDNGTVKHWDPLTGAMAGSRLFEPDARMSAVSFGRTPDGTLVIARADQERLLLHDAMSGLAICEPLTGHDLPITTIAFTSGSNGPILLASSAADETVRVWDPTPDETVVDRGVGHTRGVRSIAISLGINKELLVATGSDDRTAILWDPIVPVALDTWHGQDSPSVAFGSTPNGQLILVTSDRRQTRVRSLDEIPPKEISAMETNVFVPQALVASSDGRLVLALSVDSGLELWDPLAVKRMAKLPIGVERIALAPMENGRLLLASVDDLHSLQIWDVIDGLKVQGAGPRRGRVVLPVFGRDADGNLLLASGNLDGSVSLWDPLSGSAIREGTSRHRDGVTSLAFVSDAAGRLFLASGSLDGTIRIWSSDLAVYFVIRRRVSPRDLASVGGLLAIADDEGFAILDLRKILSELNSI